MFNPWKLFKVKDKLTSWMLNINFSPFSGKKTSNTHLGLFLDLGLFYN